MYDQPRAFPSVFGGGTIVSVAEDYAPGARRAQWAADDVRINRTYSTRLKVQTSAAILGPLAVINALGVRIGDTYRSPIYVSAATESDTGSYVQSIDVEQDSEDGKQWAVTIEYAPQDIATIMGTGYVGQGLIRPTDRAWEVFWPGGAKYERVNPFDNSDPPKPYLNTIGDPLIDPPKTEESRPVLKLTHVEPKFNEEIANTFRGTINSDVFLGCPPGSVKCTDITGEWAWDADWGLVWKITYEFEFRVDNNGDYFSQKLVNMGYRYKKNGTGNPINAVDDNGQPVTDAVLLQKNGDKMPSGTDPYLLTFAEYPSSDFTLLGIPPDILYRTQM